MSPELSYSYTWADEGNLAANARAQIFAVEPPGAANFVPGELSRPHQAVKGRATHPQVPHCFLECYQDIVLYHLHDHVFSTFLLVRKGLADKNK